MNEYFKSAIKIYNYLLEKGQLDIVDETELFNQYSKREVRECLEIFEIESRCSILKINNTIYLIPEIGNDFLGFKSSEIKNIFGGGNNLLDYYLICYIIISVLYKFYSGKNNLPKIRDFLPIIELKDFISERLEKVSSNENIKELEDEYNFNILKVYDKWDSMLEDDEKKIKTKLGFIRRTCTAILEKQNLIILDSDENIRTTKKLDDIMNYFYLDIERKDIIEKVFIEGRTIDVKS